jgi:transposase
VLVNVARVMPAQAQLLTHMGNQFESRFPFLPDARLLPTNRQTEQAIRPAVVNREVWGGNRTPAGATARGSLWRRGSGPISFEVL